MVGVILSAIFSREENDFVLVFSAVTFLMLMCSLNTCFGGD